MMPKFNLDTLLNVLLAGLLVWAVVRYFKGQPDVDAGVPAADFTLTAIQGQELSLDQLKGNYVLLDFWASWCGPCRRSHPGLVRLHNTYANARFANGGNFVVLSISLDRNRDSWLKAIEKDQLSWSTHALDQYLPATGGSVASLYDVKQIPTRFLIDDKGMIVKVNPGMRYLKRFLKEKLAD
ncbi:MAG: TlpA family protein disulfide reductase [Saprospiraceae bacterium]|nr:TlpA family protein disulfide reductase [Saprospiraceae bacterium]MDP4998955.1 TlpA family protein disulfide reductase [Saprospiraceae bacterium]